MTSRTFTAALRLSAIPLLVAATAGGGGGTDDAAAPDPRALLERSLEAAGGAAAWERAEALRIESDLESAGLTGTRVRIEDLRGGRSAHRWDLGATAGASGFDGERPWFRDSSGDVTISGSRAELEEARTEAYRTARAWWFPERWPAEVEYDRPDEVDGRAFHVLRITPEGGRPFEAWLDTGSGRIVRLVEETPPTTSTEVLSDHRRVGDLWLPHRIRSWRDAPGSERTVRVRRVEVNPDLPDGAFEVPESEVADFRMPDGASSVTLPFELANNHIYVDASVDGGEPLRFLVDTGGVNLLTRRAAEELGIAAEGSFPVGGAGEGTVQASWATPERFTVGGITFPEPRFLVIPLDEVLEAEGVDFAGLIGFEVFRRFVVTIDYAARQLTLTLPDAFDGRPGAVEVPFEFDGRHPVVQGAVDGLPGSFTIDTGSRSTLDLHGPFVAAHDLVERYDPPIEALTGWGVGGGVRSRVARAGALRLGDLEIPDVLVELTSQERGAFADAYGAGNVGGGVLKRFTVVFDYPNQRILFEPAAGGGTPEPFDRSGLWLNDVGDAFRVEDVVTDGPADEAGLAVGDLLVAVDGVPAAEVALPQLRERLRNDPPGTTVRLTVAAGDDDRRVEVVLRDLLPPRLLPAAP